MIKNTERSRDNGKRTIRNKVAGEIHSHSCCSSKRSRDTIIIVIAESKAVTPAAAPRREGGRAARGRGGNRGLAWTEAAALLSGGDGRRDDETPSIGRGIAGPGEPSHAYSYSPGCQF